MLYELHPHLSVANVLRTHLHQFGPKFLPDHAPEHHPPPFKHLSELIPTATPTPTAAAALFTATSAAIAIATPTTIAGSPTITTTATTAPIGFTIPTATQASAIGFTIPAELLGCQLRPARPLLQPTAGPSPRPLLLRFPWAML